MWGGSAAALTRRVFLAVGEVHSTQTEKGSAPTEANFGASLLDRRVGTSVRAQILTDKQFDKKANKTVDKTVGHARCEVKFLLFCS